MKSIIKVEQINGQTTICTYNDNIPAHTPLVREKVGMFDTFNSRQAQAWAEQLDYFQWVEVWANDAAVRLGIEHSDVCKSGLEYLGSCKRCDRVYGPMPYYM